MPTAERRPAAARASEAARADPPGAAQRASRRWAWAGLAAVLAVGLGLRVWGVRQGLPYAYNADEADHFVVRAITMFHDGSLNPHYFANPPAFTYLLHFLFLIGYGGRAGAERAFALHPADVYTLARLAAALLGVVALWLLYATGARLFGRAVGVLAAALEAVAFLPVFYAHLALNDVPTLAPLTLSLLGSAGVLLRGRTSDHLLAGAGLGLACATKYTAGIALAPLLAAVAARHLEGGRDRAAVLALRGLAVAAAAAVAAFVIANPYAMLDFSRFHAELARQSSLSAEAQGKLGAPRHGGFVYYLWSLTWGLGWLPSLAALGGALGVWRIRRSYGWLLVPAPLLFLLFMGSEGRYFGRWLMPVLPILCLLAALFTLRLAGALSRTIAGVRARRAGAQSGAAGRSGASRVMAAALAALLAAALLAQGLVHSVHAGLVLSRADTRNLTRSWMLAHIPAGAKIVAEPVSPDEWARRTAPGTSTASNPPQWHKYPSFVARISASGSLLSHPGAQVQIENYERTLSPALIGYYEQHGYCFLISGSTQSGRAFADRAAVPLALAYYRALARDARVLFRASPYGHGAGPVAFGFDWSFDYYPLAYERPGPLMTVYELRGGGCGR